MFNKIMNVNFYAYVSTATYALPPLKRSKGSIILSDSNAGYVSCLILQKEGYPSGIGGLSLNVEREVCMLKAGREM